MSKFHMGLNNLSPPPATLPFSHCTPSPTPSLPHLALDRRDRFQSLLESNGCRTKSTQLEPQKHTVQQTCMKTHPARFNSIHTHFPHAHKQSHDCKPSQSFPLPCPVITPYAMSSAKGLLSLNPDTSSTLTGDNKSPTERRCKKVQIKR